MYFICPHCKSALHIETPNTKVIRGACPHCGMSIEFNTIRDGIQDEQYNKSANKSLITKDEVLSFFKTYRKNVIAILAILSLAALYFITFYVVTRSHSSYKYKGEPFTIKQENTAANSLADADKKQQWIKFRSYYPYNFQTIAAKHYSDDSHLIILSEPADFISVENIRDYFEDLSLNVSSECYQSKLGYDGWIKDYVFAVNNIEKGKFDIFIEALSEKLYGSNYKAYYIDLSTLSDKVYYSNQNLNYSISAAELKEWIIDDKEKFYGKNESSVYEISKLLKSGEEGIYFSKTPGFVIWLMSKSYEAGDFLASARKFSLDADLVIGAIDFADNNKIAVIGRERSIPIYELPPMQTEIMLMLASTSESELHQSYERGHAVAGKLPGGKDFAPILLSPELWHTEYGSLLNITDQMLKSWSENGDVAYEDFRYPTPDHWAFKKGVYSDLNTKNSLTYNWNTAGVGYCINPTNEEPYRIYAVNRTGSLPVSYIPQGMDEVDPDDKVFKAEEKAYNYFSTLNNPELVRVVQYASFYQIMQYYKPNISGAHEYLSSFTPSEATLYANKQKIVESLKTEELSKRGVMSYFDRYYSNKYGYQYSRLSQSDRDEICRANATTVYEKLIRAQNNYRAFSPSSTRRKPYGLDGDELQLFNQIFSIVPLNKAKDDYVQDNQNNHSNWIKCPSIVLSWSLKDSTSWTGGHNLNSEITPIYLDDNVVSGNFKVTKNHRGIKEIRINPSDLTEITPSMLREVNRTNIIGSNKFSYRPIVVRRRNDVLRDTQRRTARGFNFADHVYK